jgi:hypothetical protein
MELGERRYTSTLPLVIEGHQWLTRSHQINSGKEPRYPFIKSWVGSRAIQDVLEERKILVPNRIQTLGQWNRHYSDQVTQLPKFQPTTGHEGLALAALPLGRKHHTQCTGGWVGKRASMTGAQNLLPTLGFNPQTMQPIASHYTHVMKVYRESRSIAPH